jgi:hypothetical protein
VLEFIELLIHFVITVFKLLQPGGVKVVILKPAIVLAFYKALVKRKYSRLYSNKTKRIPGRKPQDRALFDLVIEMKSRNPSFGYGRISTQIFESFGMNQRY